MGWGDKGRRGYRRILPNAGVNPTTTRIRLSISSAINEQDGPSMGYNARMLLLQIGRIDHVTHGHILSDQSVAEKFLNVLVHSEHAVFG